MFAIQSERVSDNWSMYAKVEIGILKILEILNSDFNLHPAAFCIILLCINTLKTRQKQKTKKT